MKLLFSGIAILALSACGGPAPFATPIEQHSASAKTVVVPVRNAKLRIQYDAASVPAKAVLTYVEPVGISDLLFINKEVIPTIHAATGCRVVAPPVADNRLLPTEGRTTVPISC